MTEIHLSSQIITMT